MVTAIAKRDGQALLALVFLIGMIMVGIGAALVLTGNSFINTSYGFRAAQAAQAAAASGAQDALLQLARNGSNWNPGTYSFAVDTATASITVTRNSPSTGLYTIVSSATVSNHTWNINVVASVNASTSQVGVVSWQSTQ